MKMADTENSPSKRMSALRKSPPYHPYVRAGAKSTVNKSPLKQQIENATFKHISDKNFFSFSGGSASLFPSSNNKGPSQTHSVRSAMSELSNILKHKDNVQQGPPPIIKLNEETDALGIIGGQRKSVGFIPVESSCTISGGNGLGKVSVVPDLNVLKNNKSNKRLSSSDDGFHRSTSFTYVPTGSIPSRSLEGDEAEHPQQLAGIQWPIYNKQRIIVHAKTFYPPPPSELPLPTNLGTAEDHFSADENIENDFLIYEEAPSPSAKENEESYYSYRSHDGSFTEGTHSKNTSRIPLSDISGCSSIISCEIVSSDTLNDSGLSAMDEKSTFGLGMNSVEADDINQDFICHEEIDFELGQEIDEKPRKFFKNWIPGRGELVDLEQKTADKEDVPSDVISLSDNETASVVDSLCESPELVPAASQRPSSGNRKFESFNCSFNSSFNDHLANLGLDSIQGPEKGILTEQVNPFFDFPEYSFDILNHWVEFERKVRPRWRFMDKQKDISQKMRSILIDWLVEVGVEYELQEATLFLAVSFIDRFLSKMAVSRGKLQLIGTAALFVASKYEEITPPEIKDFVYITDETYSKEQLLRMEKIMLNVLNFDLMAPTSYDFSKAYCSLLQLNGRATALAMYLTELTLTDGTRFMNFLPSLIAIGAVGLARYTVDNVFWDERLESLTKHRKRVVEKTAEHLYRCFYDAPVSQQTAIHEKYKSVKYCAIALSMLPSKLPWRTP